MADEQYTPIQRNCTKCLLLKPLTEFTKAARGKYGHSARCKACDKVYAQENSKKINRQQLALYHRKQEPKRQAKREEVQARIDSPDKRCCTCQQIKPKSDFAKNKSAFDGLRRRCKECGNAANKKYREENPEASARSSRNWVLRNPEKVRQKANRRYKKDPEKYRSLTSKWRAENPEKSKESYSRCNRKRRLKATVRIHESVGNQIRYALKSGKSGRKTFELLGYTLNDLMRNLERQFLKGMSWDNYGEWHIDHIVPLSSFVIDSVESPEIKYAWALSNLRPLWAADNLSKSDKRIFLI